jgi:hypothetical protein
MRKLVLALCLCCLVAPGHAQQTAAPLSGPALEAAVREELARAQTQQSQIDALRAEIAQLRGVPAQLPQETVLASAAPALSGLREFLPTIVSMGLLAVLLWIGRKLSSLATAVRTIATTQRQPAEISTMPPGISDIMRAIGGVTQARPPSPAPPPAAHPGSVVPGAPKPLATFPLGSLTPHQWDTPKSAGAA